MAAIWGEKQNQITFIYDISPIIFVYDNILISLQAILTFWGRSLDLYGSLTHISNFFHSETSSIWRISQT